MISVKEKLHYRIVVNSYGMESWEKFKLKVFNRLYNDTTIRMM
jgi:hypothetical protein